jgi:iron complex transport system substrate-binding protein
MNRVLVAYWNIPGNTGAMAKRVAQGATDSGRGDGRGHHVMFRKLAGLLCAAVLLFALAGCSRDNKDNGEFSPITIEHVYGKTAITKKPERIATLYFGNQDVVLALGVVPVGFSAANYGLEAGDTSGLLPWTKGKLIALGEFSPNVFDDIAGVDLEAVAACEPDLILAPYSGMTESEYNTLSLIAPVVAYPEGAWKIEWKQWVRITAKAMGMDAEGEALIAQTESLMTTEAAKHPIVTGKKIVWTNFNVNNLSQAPTYTPSDNRPEFLKALGLEYPQSYYNLFTDASKYGLAISAENADVFNEADVLIGYFGNAAVTALQEHSIWKEIKPIKNGALVPLSSQPGYIAASGTATPLSIAYTLDTFLTLISEALEKNTP